MESDRSPLDRAADLFVFGPVGFLLEAPNLWPKFVERGRRTLTGLRDQGSSSLPVQRSLARLPDHAWAALEGLGLARPNGSGRSTDHAPGSRPAASPGEQHRARTPSTTGIDPESLAIPGYDSLSASQVVPRLDGLSGEELELVRRYESGTRGRKTILGKIAQLQSAAS